MAIPIVLSPPMPKPILELAHAMLPEGFELRVLEQHGPEFFKGLKDAQYFTGFARTSLGPDFYRAAPQLKLVQLISAGYDRCDLAAARQANVPIANNGGANSIAVAEHTLTLILSVLKRLAWMHANVTAGKWRVGDFAENRVYELYGKTVGIVGLGTIGKKVARRLHGFDVEIIYYDIVRLTEDQEEALGVKFRLLDELLSISDIVTLHVPLTSLTRNMMDARTLGKMKETAVLINTCRGPVVDEEALFQALTTKHLAAAGLDVMEQEPPPADHKFFNLPNVILTPHMAGPTWENWTRIFRNAFDNIQRVAAGRPPLWVIPELRDL
jgi:phosphoglycerate dehydrogenase-like enzyme